MTLVDPIETSSSENEPPSCNPSSYSVENKDQQQQQQSPLPSFVRCEKSEIVKRVLRCKLSKMRHLVLSKAIDSAYLETNLFPKLVHLFDPQPVIYNGGIANIRNWKISCYLEVMDGGVPTTEPNIALLDLFRDLLDACDDLFLFWYRQQHACNHHNHNNHSTTPVIQSCRRLMTFITRYTPAPGEQALLKHVDGAGKVDGSCVVALPTDFPFQGGGLTFWDGRPIQEIHYDTRSGDLAFIDRAVWHQADPITSGMRWALVIFYKVEKS